MRVYIAGKITGDPTYKNKFDEVARRLTNAGYQVMNPAILPDGFEYDHYMTVCTAMIDVCEAVCMLPDWKQSPGAKYEYGHAAATDKAITYYTDFEKSGRLEVPDGFVTSLFEGLE